ncbi:MAG TPA: FtsX-like permease family protein [Gemmatimonadales bacterium]
MSHQVLQDVRYGLRQLRRSPGFTLVAILTLALGIGANTIIFGIVNGLLLRPLAVSEADRLVALFATNHRSGESRALSYPEYLDYRNRSGIFAGLAAQQGLPVGIGAGERAEVVWGEIVSENYFSVLGLRPVLGRTFQQQDGSGPGSAVGSWAAERRLTMLVVSCFALLALTLGAIGIYGVMTYFVSQRTREIGIRIALGALPQEILQLVLSQGVWLAAAGILAGLCGALAATRMLASMLFQVRPTDPPTYIVTALALALVALVATFVPALRATRVDPIESMRSE